ncbi:MAG: hypothetical protein HS128_14025 [Ideonella sp.]|nr:hypothetical protein [Ideonella sp.]MCC7457309.1 hypothetical protein [Nitrospira sp.]
MTGTRFALVLALATAWCGPAAAQPVEIHQGAEVGSGYAFRRGDACLVLTAFHVVRSDVAEIRLFDRTGARNAAERTFQVPSEDIALLEVSDKRNIGCSERWPDSSWFASLNPTSRDLFEAVRHSPEGGRETLIALRYAGRTTHTLTLAPVDPKTRIQKGDSGSMVRLDGRLVGIVKQVRPDADRVEVVRIDVIDKLLGERLRGGGRSPLAIEGVRSRGRVDPRWSPYLREWVARSTGRQAVPAGDPGAKCRIAVDLMDIRPTQVPNPQLEQAGGQDCSLITLVNRKLGATCESEKRKSVASTPRTLAAYIVSADVQVQPKQGAPVAKLASGTVPIEGRATRSIEEQFSALATVMGPAAKELIAQAGCD